MLCYEFAAVWWSLLGHLAKESKLTKGSELQKGCEVLKGRLAEYCRREKIKSKLPLRRFGLGKLKVKKNLETEGKSWTGTSPHGIHLGLDKGIPRVRC